MKIAGIQFNIAWEDPSKNFSKVSDLANRARSQGASWIVLPEMFATGFSMNADEIAEHAPTIRAFLGELARDLDLWVLGGYAEPTAKRPRNAAVLISPEGEEMLHYQKIHPFTYGGESEHFDSGERIHTAEVDGVRVTPFVCYDLRFPEIFRAATLRTDLFVVIANWPAARRHHWVQLLRGRAIENQAYVLGVNRVGKGGGLTYLGDSMLLDPLGLVIDQGGDAEALVCGEIDPVNVATIREKLPFQQDRRETLYRTLAPR